MSSVDSRIVTMKFDNSQFEQGARTSLSTLEKLKQSMNFGGIVSGSMKSLSAIGGALTKLGLKTPFAPLIKTATAGFSGVGSVIDKMGLKNPFTKSTTGAADLQDAAQKVAGPGGIGSITGGITSVSGKFLAMSTIAITALQRITDKAISTGTDLAKSLTLDPVKAGFDEYELKMDSIQTILANTSKYGTKLKDVDKALNELNEYADKTIYNFGDMTKNIGLFTNSGLRVEEATSIIKGFSNAAAASGTSAQGAASAAYQLSQAMSAGQIRLMDWRSLTNVGMGNQNMKDGILDIAGAMGTLEKSQTSSKDIQKDFNASLESGWLTADVMSNYLQIMAGDLSKAEQKQLGLTDAQIDNFTKTQKTAEDSATKVRTLTKLIGTLQEAVGSTWSETFNTLFGDFNEATKLFTNVNDTLGGMLEKGGERRNKLLKGWDELGGRDVLIEALSNAFTALMNIVKPIGQAFRDIFPPQTAEGLFALTERFRDFTESMKPSQETMGKIRDIAGGVFAIFGIGKQLLGGVVTLFTTLFSTVGGGNGTFLGFLATIGNLIKRFNDFLAESGLVTAFFKGLGGILALPLGILKGVAAAFTSLFGGFDAGKASKVGEAVDGIGNRLSGLEIVGEKIKAFFTNIGEFFGNLGGHIGDALMGIGDVVAGMFTADTFGSTLDVINTTLLGGLVLMIKNFFNKGVNVDLTGGLFDGIKETLGGATNAFENMQNTLKADILLKLAIAIGVMAAALLVLSTIDPAALTKALAAMGAGFGVLVGAMAVLMKVMGAAGLVQLYIVTSAMTKMAASILLLAFALKVLAGIKFGAMLRGLFGLAAMMLILTKAMLPLAAGSKGMGRAAASLILIGIAVNLLAVALKVFASMSWEEMARGLVGMTGALLGVALAMKLMPKNILVQAAAILVLSTAMNAMATALKLMATLSWGEMIKGLVAIAGSLVVIGLAMRLMPKTMLLTAAGLLVTANALVILSGALKVMGGMSWEDIAQSLVLLGGALLILAVGLNAIGLVGTIGSVGLMAAAVALSVFVPVMLAFGAMDWMSILKSLAMLAGLFVVLGLAGLLLAPVTPVILALSVAMVFMGAALLLAGTGALAAATAFGIVVAAGSAGIQILVGLLASLVRAIPPALAAFGKGVVLFAVAIGKGAPRIAKAFQNILSGLIGAVIKNVPKLGKAFLVMLATALRVIVTAVPMIVNAGLNLIISFLQAISSKIPKIIDLAAEIIVKFINGIARNLKQIIQSGVNLILKFINGVSRALDNNSEALGEAGGRLAVALVKGMASGIRGGAGIIKDAALEAGKAAMAEVKNFFKIGSPSKRMRDEVGHWIPVGMALGIDDEADAPVNAIHKMGVSTMDKLSRTMAAVEEGFALNADLDPTITPVLDLGALTKEANKMSSILTTAPIMAGVSYQTAADISAMTQSPPPGEDGPDDGPDGTGGGTSVSLTLNQHSPKPIDSVASYRGGKTLISLAKEALS